MGGGGGLSLCVINYYFVDVCLFYFLIIRGEWEWGLSLCFNYYFVDVCFTFLLFEVSGGGGLSLCVIDYYFVVVCLFYFFVIRGERGWRAVIMSD